jgi:hypothetical protein
MNASWTEDPPLLRAIAPMVAPASTGDIGRNSSTKVSIRRSRNRSALLRKPAIHSTCRTSRPRTGSVLPLVSTITVTSIGTFSTVIASTSRLRARSNGERGPVLPDGVPALVLHLIRIAGQKVRKVEEERFLRDLQDRVELIASDLRMSQPEMEGAKAQQHFRPDRGHVAQMLEKHDGGPHPRPAVVLERFRPQVWLAREATRPPRLTHRVRALQCLSCHSRARRDGDRATSFLRA